MNIQQMEYIVAVDNLRHFASAAEACYVTQPTLSMMIKKLEEELDIIIFDRSTQPVTPTPIGEKVIAEARKILSLSHHITDMVKEEKGAINGQLNLGVIPTIAPYVLPEFLKRFVKKYPSIKLKISENTTDVIINKLKQGRLDVGLLVTPIHEDVIREIPLYNEPFVVFSSHGFKKTYVLPEDIDPNELWLLEEGHCFRSQIINLCELKKQAVSAIEYESGSLETLKELVLNNQGVTILPKLATLHLTKKQQKHIHYFKSPPPVREVSLIVHKNFHKDSLIKVLREEIISIVPEDMKSHSKSYKVPITL